jgi:protein SCO1/2
MDDPRYIAVMVGDWLSSWQRHIKGESYTMAPVADESSSDRGAYLFKTRCSACHTVGSGDKIGPDLLGVAEARSHEWLTRYVSTPDEVLASGDPIATALFEKYRKVRMPNLRLGEEDVTALIRFLRARGAAGQVPVKVSELGPLSGARAARAPVEQTESLSLRTNDRDLASGFELPRKGEAP